MIAAAAGLVAKLEQGSAPVHAFEAKLGAYANSAASRGTDNAGSCVVRA